MLSSCVGYTQLKKCGFAAKKTLLHNGISSRNNIITCLSSPHLSKRFPRIQRRSESLIFRNIAVPIFVHPLYDSTQCPSKDVFLVGYRVNKMVTSDNLNVRKK